MSQPVSRRAAFAQALLALAVLLVAAPSHAQTCGQGANSSLQVNYAIVAPTTNADTTPLTQNVTFNLYTASVTTGSPPPAATAYVKTASGIGPVPAGSSVTYTQTAGVAPNVTVYAYATAQDSNGEGAPSAAVCKSFPQDTSPPGKPGLTAS